MVEYNGIRGIYCVKAIYIIFSVLILTTLAFYFIHITTPSPGQPSGNGNPLLLVMVAVVVALVVMVLQLVKILAKFSLKSWVIIALLLVAVIHWGIGFQMQAQLLEDYREVQAQAYEEKFGEVDYEYIESITSSVLSIHMNSYYFNLNTYFMFLSLVLFLSLIAYLFKNGTVLTKKVFSSALGVLAGIATILLWIYLFLNGEFESTTRIISTIIMILIPACLAIFASLRHSNFFMIIAFYWALPYSFYFFLFPGTASWFVVMCMIYFVNYFIINHIKNFQERGA